jgi:tungstate transport system permease protein
MIEQGWRLIWVDPTTPSLIENTLRLALWSTGIGLLLGLPLAFWLATGSSRVRRAGRTLANSGIGLPPVGIGVYVFLLVGHFPLESFWRVGMHAMVFVQTIITVPIVVALATGAILRLPAGLVEQARAFGAGRWRLFAFVLREARVGILAAVIVALGSAIGEVGAVTVLVDPSNPEATLAMRILGDEAAGHPQDAFAGVAYQVEHAMVILAMLLVLGLVLTVIQQAQGRSGSRLPWIFPRSIEAAGGEG